MIEAKVPKDIRVYETKLVGPLTGRELVCSVLMLTSAIITYNICCTVFDMSLDMFVYVGIIACLPFAALGWYKPHGMRMETYIQRVAMYNAIAPLYRTPKNVIYRYKKDTSKISKENQKHRTKIIESDPQFKAYL